VTLLKRIAARFRRHEGPIATVLIPTHEHEQCLRHSIASVLRQSVQDFELFVVGDGAPAGTRSFVEDLAARDPRVRYFDFEKGERKGERHRHAALQHASGRIIAYLGDDDLWMPDHLATVVELLDRADFGHTLHLGIDQAGDLFFVPIDLARPDFRARMLSKRSNYFDFTFGAHRLDAYRRLRSGWEPPPPGESAADLHMWRKFLAARWCRAATATVATAICTQTHLRPHLSDAERAEELARLGREMLEPGRWEGIRDRLQESLMRRPPVVGKVERRPI
jgi:glycosyltransferase involved in cell wall biosynthesis